MKRQAGDGRENPALPGTCGGGRAGSLREGHRQLDALTAHFVVPTRSARPVKAAIIRRVLDRMSAAGIEVASQTIVVRPDQ
jgi:hypothetical protein